MSGLRCNGRFQAPLPNERELGRSFTKAMTPKGRPLDRSLQRTASRARARYGAARSVDVARCLDAALSRLYKDSESRRPGLRATTTMRCVSQADAPFSCRQFARNAVNNQAPPVRAPEFYDRQPGQSNCARPARKDGEGGHHKGRGSESKAGRGDSLRGRKAHRRCSFSRANWESPSCDNGAHMARGAQIKHVRFDASRRPC